VVIDETGDGTKDDISDEVEAIPGVASAEVTFAEGRPPVARVWLDGTRDPEEVRLRVSALLGSHVPSGTPTDRPARRSGLGKGLSELIAEDHGPSGLPHLNGGSTFIAVQPVMSTLARVGVVEMDASVVVEVEDALGTRAEAVVGDDASIDLAVIRAVRNLLEPGARPDDGDAVKIIDVDPSGGDEMVVVTVTHPDGRRSAGAAFVEFGRPWAVARACAQALRGS
jgi:hypothetical protein